MTRDTGEEVAQPAESEGEPLGPVEGNGPRAKLGWLKNRPAMAVLGAAAAAIGSLIPPTVLILLVGGEICSGYKVDVPAWYSDKILPFAFQAAVVGALLGAAIGWPGRLLARGGWRAGLLIAAVGIAGVACTLVSCFWAIVPGC